MKTYTRLWSRLCSWENLVLAYERAKRGKTNRPSVRTFVKRWPLELALLRHQLKTKTYRPVPLRRFVLRDPKTRVISVSAFRDRIVHHALVNILQPIFEPRFINDSYASRKGRGTLPALRRFDAFKRRATRNGRTRSGARNANDVIGYALKCDVKQYFDTVDHETLLAILRERVKDEDVLALAKTILENHDNGTPGKGMPLGNWTSQFFANVYLDKLDWFVKHGLKARHYIRYVDDFLILDESRERLGKLKTTIDGFLKERLLLELHPEKSAVIPLRTGVTFLGYRIFYHHKLVRERSVRKMKRKLEASTDVEGDESQMRAAASWNGWSAYAKRANTYRLRERLAKSLEKAEEPS